MFYSVFVLGKKGPLAKVWLAAHWDKKISKAQILETNIAESVESILTPRIKLSLRTSSHLMLGVVRIYARKTQYLLQDCQDAAFKIKSAFRPDAVDLPDGKTEASTRAINLPEFDADFDLMPDPAEMHMDIPMTTPANIRNITLQEDIGSINFDESSEWEAARNATAGIDLQDGRNGSVSGRGTTNLNDLDRPLEDDGFGNMMGAAMDDDIFAVRLTDEDRERMEREQEAGRADQTSVAPQGRPSSRVSEVGSDFSMGPPSNAPSMGPSTPGDHGAGDMDGDIFGQPPVPISGGQDTLVLDTLPEGTGGFERGRRKKRRKLGIIIDDVKILTGEEMKTQLSDCSDILTQLDLAPPSKKLMHWKKTGGSEKLFALPERTLHSKVLSLYYSRNLQTSTVEDGEEDQWDIKDGAGITNGRTHEDMDLDDLQLEQMLPPSSPRKEGLRPTKPRDKYEKEVRLSPKKKPRREHDKENDQEGRHPPKSPRGSRTPRRDQSSIQAGRDGSIQGPTRQSDYQPDFDDEYDQVYSVGPPSVGPVSIFIFFLGIKF
jgi:cohesin complex subunit SCC1